MSQPILTRNILAIDITSGVNVSSPIQDVSNATLFTIQAIHTGSTPSGTVALQGSLDGINWNNLTTISISGASGLGLGSFGPVAVPFIRVNYTHTSGTISSLKVYLATKMPA